jgi:hypothetical protein
MRLFRLVLLVVSAGSTLACAANRGSGPNPWSSPIRLDSAVVDLIRQDTSYFVLFRGWGRVDTMSVQISGTAERPQVFGSPIGPPDSITASFGSSRRGWLRVEPIQTTVTGYALSTGIEERRMPFVEDFPAPSMRIDVSGSTRTVQDVVELQLSSGQILSQSTRRDDDVYVVTWFVQEPRRGRREVEVSFRLQITPHASNQNCSRVHISWLRETKGEREQEWRREPTVGTPPAYMDRIQSWFRGRGCR